MESLGHLVHHIEHPDAEQTGAEDDMLSLTRLIADLREQLEDRSEHSERYIGELH